jgi:acetyltransferase
MASEISAILHGQPEDDFVDPTVVTVVLDKVGIQTARLVECRSEEQAVGAAAGIGYPVVMKAALEGVSHKSDIGGIVLDLQDDQAVREAYKSLEKRATEVLGSHEKFAVHLQEMVSGGQEVILGAVRDPVFGPTLMFGSGGTEVEGLGDVVFSVAPLVVSEFEVMVKSTWAGKKLDGFRHLSPGDILGLREAAARLSALMIENPEISELEINPLIVLPPGQGVVAVDARMKLKRT